MSDDLHELTDDDVLRLYLSGFMSGAATVLEAAGESHRVALAEARELIGGMMRDPAVRTSILDMFMAGGGGAHLPVLQGDEGGTP